MSLGNNYGNTTGYNVGHYFTMVVAITEHFGVGDFCLFDESINAVFSYYINKILIILINIG